MGTSFSDLIKKQKSADTRPEVSANETPQKESKEETAPAEKPANSLADTVKSAGFSLRDTLKQTKANNQRSSSSTGSQSFSTGSQSNTQQQLVPKKEEKDPLASLSDDDFILDGKEGNPEIGNLDSLGKYQFDEQAESFPDYSVEDFRNELEILSNSVGEDVINNFNICLKRLKEHPFLAEHLRPEDIGIAVGALRKSYALTVKAKTTRKEKKQVRKTKHTDAVLDALSDISF